MHFHLIGVCGTGMGALAGLLKEAGHRVSGSDRAFEPPMGDALRRWGIELVSGYTAENVTRLQPERVVVGNVCRRDNPEAVAAIEAGIPYVSMARAIHDEFLLRGKPFVVAGTHGKTTTTSLLAFLLDRTGRAPGFLIGGLPQDFEHSFRAAAAGAPFVIEGDEYDSAFFEKSPKFLQYAPSVAAINAVEHDHIDIYPTMEAYRDAFQRFVALMPAQGVLVGFAGDPEVRALLADAPCRICTVALDDDDCGGLAPDYHGTLLADGRVRLEGPGGFSVELRPPLTGRHNARNMLTAMAMAHEGAGVPLQALADALPSFGGVRRRQELRASVNGVAIYDDFAHHPTAVDETLRGLRGRHAQGKLIAVFEPRSATASRSLHQSAYPAAFAAANLTLIAPVGRSEIAASERLDVDRIAGDIRAQGRQAEACADVDTIVRRVAEVAAPGDAVVIMSNGAFGGIHQRVIDALSEKGQSA